MNCTSRIYQTRERKEDPMTQKSVLVDYYYEVGRKSSTAAENENGTLGAALKKLMRLLTGWTPVTE